MDPGGFAACDLLQYKTMVQVACKSDPEAEGKASPHHHRTYVTAIESFLTAPKLIDVRLPPVDFVVCLYECPDFSKKWQYPANPLSHHRSFLCDRFFHPLR